MRVAFRAGGFVCALALLGCAGSSADRNSVEYQAGYSDGCATGTARAGRLQQEPVRQQEVYEKSSDYRAGWASGYNVCGASANPGRS